MLFNGAITTVISLCLLSLSTPSHGFTTFGTRPSTKRSTLSMSSALIVQNKGGGHGELGYQLCKNLLTNPKITSVTILQDDTCDESKEPFASYNTELLPDVNVIKTPLSGDAINPMTLQSILGGRDASFDYIWDNASKKPTDAGKALVDVAASWGTVKLFTYVSSAGMYQPASDASGPLSEDATPVKESAGQHLFEEYAVSCGLPFVTFRPQYIYGPKANKFDYLDWYFDRLVRELPLPIPEDGMQKVSLTNAVDVASLLASVLEEPEAAVKGRYFNCGTDQLYTYDEVAYMCADAAGIDRKDVKIEHYEAGLGKADFPFRLTDFHVSPDKAKEVLKWEGPKSDLAEDLKWYFKGYEERKMPPGQMPLLKDWEIVKGSKSVYDKWAIDMSEAKI